MSDNKETLGIPASGTFRSYIMGFILSVVLTLVPFWLVNAEMIHGWALIMVLASFAVAQLAVQLLLFLHLGHEAKPRWNILALLFAILVVVIVVLGSIWIMYNLDYNMMSPQEMDEYMLKQSEKGF